MYVWTLCDICFNVMVWYLTGNSMKLELRTPPPKKKKHKNPRSFHTIPPKTSKTINPSIHQIWGFWGFHLPRVSWAKSKGNAPKAALPGYWIPSSNRPAENRKLLDGNQKSGGIHSPVEGMVVDIPLFTRVLYIHPRWLFGISEPSTVCCHYVVFCKFFCEFPSKKCGETFIAKWKAPARTETEFSCLFHQNKINSNSHHSHL